MSSAPSDAADARRLAAATRRLVDLVRRSQAEGETSARALESIEAACSLLEDSAHPGPWHQRGLTFRGLDPPTSDDYPPRDFARFFPYSPVVGPLNPIAPPVRFELEGGRLRGRVRFGAAYTGPPGCVHGGVIAELFDEMLGSVNVANEMGGMTGTLRVVYRAPTPIDEELHFESWVERVEGRKIFSRGTLHFGDRLTAEADGVFIQGAIQRIAVEKLGAAARAEETP